MNLWLVLFLWVAGWIATVVVLALWRRGHSADGEDEAVGLVFMSSIVWPIVLVFLGVSALYRKVRCS